MIALPLTVLSPLIVCSRRTGFSEGRTQTALNYSLKHDFSRSNWAAFQTCEAGRVVVESLLVIRQPLIDG